VAKRIGADKERRTDTLAGSLGAQITRLRLSRGWSQIKLADLVGYDERYIRQLELGAKSPTLRTLINIAQAFAIPLSTLIKRAERGVNANFS
jgi:transcriptional regulator with XRE-family HTH domain